MQLTKALIVLTDELIARPLFWLIHRRSPRTYTIPRSEK